MMSRETNIKMETARSSFSKYLSETSSFYLTNRLDRYILQLGTLLMNTLPVIRSLDSCVSFQSELMLAWTKQLYGKAIKAISSPLFDVCAHEHTYVRMHWCRKICANMRDYHSCQKAITFRNEATIENQHDSISYSYKIIEKRFPLCIQNLSLQMFFQKTLSNCVFSGIIWNFGLLSWN